MILGGVTRTPGDVTILGYDHVARLRETLQRAIARRRELERRGTPHFARRGADHAGSNRIFYCWRMIRCSLNWPTTRR